MIDKHIINDLKFSNRIYTVLFDIEGNIIASNNLFQKKILKGLNATAFNFFSLFLDEIRKQLISALKIVNENDLFEIESFFDDKALVWEININYPSSVSSQTIFTAIGTNVNEKIVSNKDHSISQEQFELAIKGSNDGIWDWDLNSNSLFVSPQWKKMLGYDDHELENSFETFTSLLHKDDFDRVFAYVDEYLTGAIEHYDIDFRMYHKNGGFRWVNAKGAALRDSSGKPYRMAGSHTDITQRKNDEVQLSTAYQLLEQAGKIAKVGVWEVDLNSGKTSWTKATYDIFDVTESDSPDLYQNFDFYKENGSRDLIYKAVNELINNKIGFDLELEIISNLGIHKWVRAIGNINDANPDEVKIYGTIQDITSSKNIVFELEEKQNLQNTIIGTNLGTWEWNLKTNETKYSSNWLQILGYSAQQLMPFTFQTCIDLIHHEDKAMVAEKYQQHLSGNTPFLEVEYRMQHANNQFIWVLDKGKVLAKDENGKPLMMYGAIQDISERKKEEEQKFLLENLINFSSDAIQVSDEEGKLIYINDTATQRLGIEKSIANSVYVYQFENTINSVEKWQAHVNELKQNTSLVVFGENTNAVTKESFPVEVTVRYLKIKEKGYVLAISRDITERIKAQSELIKTKEKLEETGRTAQVGAFEIDVVNNQLIYSEVFKEMMHLPKDYVSTLDEGFQFLLPGEDFEKAKQFTFNCIVQGIPFDEEFRFRNLKNETIWVRVICKPEFKLGKVISVFGTFQNINYLKNAEEKIRDYANRISAILESTNDNVFALDAEFKYTAFNHIHKKLIFDRFKMNVSVGMSIFSIPFSQEEKLWIQNDISQALSGKQFSLIREYFNAEQNKTLYLEINFNPIFNDRNDIVGAAIFSKDISVQKQAELETKNLYDLTQLLIEISTSYINVDLRDLEPVVNHSLAMLGTFIEADRCYIFDYDWEKQICINTYEWCAQGITQQIENLQSVPIEVLNGWDVDHKANKAVYIADVDALETGSDLKEILSSQQIKSIITIPIIDKGYCLGFVGFDYVKSKHVISEKEKILLFVYAQMYINLLKRQKFEKRLLFQEEKYRNIIANMNLGLLEVDTHENIVFANQSFCEMSGYALEDLIGKNAQKIFSNSKTQFHYDQVQERRKAGNSDIYELEVKIANNAKRWWLISGGPQYNDNKELIGSVGIHLDITEQKRLQGEQQLLLNLTQTQNERLRNFAYIVSHNLRSHTVNIKSLLEILIETQPDLKSLEMTGLVMQVADNLLETIHHLSDVALMNTDDAKDTTTINLYERTQRAIENVSAMAIHHQVEIINHLYGDEQIKGVPAYIDSIVLNFLTNGIRYRATDRKPFVKITSEMDDKYLILKISDNGLGIDLKRHSAKIFGMYKTFHKHPESRGVGLFMTKNKVEAMGGKIEVESEVDVGTTFKIYFQHA